MITKLVVKKLKKDFTNRELKSEYQRQVFEFSVDCLMFMYPKSRDFFEAEKVKVNLAFLDYILKKANE